MTENKIKKIQFKVSQGSILLTSTSFIWFVSYCKEFGSAAVFQLRQMSLTGVSFIATVFLAHSLQHEAQ